jgi:hypothetical protein
VSSYDVAADDRRRDRRALLVVLVVLLLLLGGLYAGGYALTSDRMPRGTKVGGVRVGGLSPSAARLKVARETTELAARPLRVVVDDRAFTIRPADVGLEIDVPGSVGQVPVGRSFDPRDMWDALVASTDVPLQVVAVGDGVERRVAGIAAKIDEPVVDGDVVFEDGRARAVYPRTGHVLDRDAAAEALVSSYPSNGETVELGLSDAAPAVSTSEVSRVMKAFANPAVSGAVTYRFGAVRVVVRPEDYAAALSMTASDGRLRPRVDGDRLWSLFGRVERAWGTGSRQVRVADRILSPTQAVEFLREEVVAGFLAVVRKPQRQRIVRFEVARLRGR